MKCPYCQEEMKLGVIQSPNEIAWLPKKAKLLAGAELQNDSVVLAERSFLKGSSVNAYRCNDCKKVIIDYDTKDNEK